MSLLNKLFKKTEKEKSAVKKKIPAKIKETIKPAAVNSEKTEAKAQPAEFKAGGVIVSSLNTEKAMSSQRLNQYVFKVTSSANKIEIAKAVGKNYNVKIASVNIINIPRKERRVGKTKGFKSGYKKAIVTLAKGQTIEIK